MGYGQLMADSIDIGHVHLRVAEIDRALRFYCDLLGLELVQRLGDEAAFLSSGDYHHRIALNTWHSRGGAPHRPEVPACTTSPSDSRRGRRSHGPYGAASTAASRS